MRVLIVTSFAIPGEYDGTAMLPIKITRALRSRGVEVVLAHLKARRPWRGVERTEFEGTPLYNVAPPSWVTGLKAIQREHRFDLVHAQHYGGATRAYAACRLAGWPMVYEIHSPLGEEVERDRLGRGFKFRAYQALERRVFRHASQVIVLGEPVRDLVLDRGVPAERIHLIYPGIDLAEYERPVPEVEVPGLKAVCAGW